MSSGNYSVDIDNQSAGNYGYDEIGNLKKDVSENIDTVRWTVYGKINRIVKSSGSTVIDYGYDPGGNRTTKKVNINDTVTTSYYVRDAQGNVLAIYSKKDEDSLKWNEQHLYGSSRLGMWLPDSLPTSPPIVMDSTAIQDSLMIGSRTYELTNHLGNVLSTISDKKIGNDSSGTVNYYLAEVLSQNDFYPFGMLEPGRQYSPSTSSGLYRYGFNGKEQDPETYGQGNIYDYGFRIYNPRLGKFLSVDPLQPSYPYYTPYQFSGNLPIVAIDLDGLEQYVVTYYKDQNNATTRIQIRSVINNKGDVQNQHIHKTGTTEDVAKGNVLVFEIKKNVNQEDLMTIVYKRNTPNSSLTKTEKEIFNKYKKPEPETDKSEDQLLYPAAEPNNKYDSRFFENSSTITYNADYKVIKQSIIPLPGQHINIQKQYFFNQNESFFDGTKNTYGDIMTDLKPIADVLKKNQNLKVVVIGNSDNNDASTTFNTPTHVNGELKTFKDLLLARAKNIAGVLEDLGVNKNQIEIKAGKTNQSKNTTITIKN